VVQEASAAVKLVFLESRSAIPKGALVPQPGPLKNDTCVALSPDGHLLFPPTMDIPTLYENLRRLAQYQFGLGLRNLDEHNDLRGKLTEWFYEK